VNIERDQDTLRITGVTRLSGADAKAFRNELQAALRPGLRTIAIDLSETRFLDSSGLGALVALRQTANRTNGAITVRLLNPTRPVEQLVRLTRLDRVFEIAK